MTMTNLGNGFTPKARSDDFIAQLQQDIYDAVLAEVRLNITKMAVPAPVVHVAAAPIPPAPNVTVNAPEMPEMGPMNCTVEMPGIDRLVTVLNDLKGLLSAPVVRTVSRDPEGLITKITEGR